MLVFFAHKAHNCPIGCLDLKEPKYVSVLFPLFTQQRQSLFGQRYVPVFIALGLANIDESPITVDILNFQVCAFGQAQATGIDRGQTNPIARQPNAVQKFVNFITTEYDR